MTAGRLSGKVFLVTGSASGIGHAVTDRFAAEGARVVASDLDPRIDETRWPSAPSGAVITQRGDVSEEEDCALMVRAAINEWQQLDGLVNCAGIAPRGPIASTDRQTWDRVIGTNLFGAFTLSLLASEEIRKHGRGGSIVHIASVAALVGMANLASYSASKGGVISLVRELAIELAPAGIRANCVCPGATDTPAFHRRSDLTDEASIKSARDAFPLLKYHGRLIQPSEIADAALFLSSEEARMITGSVLAVDAGYSAQ